MNEYFPDVYKRQSNSELAYYFANYNNSSAILDAINFGENVSCGYNSDFKEYGVISVSYTHLDVYKRQMMKYLWFRYWKKK